MKKNFKALKIEVFGFPAEQKMVSHRPTNISISLISYHQHVEHSSKFLNGLPPPRIPSGEESGRGFLEQPRSHLSLGNGARSAAGRQRCSAAAAAVTTAAKVRKSSSSERASERPMASERSQEKKRRVPERGGRAHRRSSIIGHASELKYM